MSYIVSCHCAFKVIRGSNNSCRSCFVATFFRFNFCTYWLKQYLVYYCNQWRTQKISEGGYQVSSQSCDVTNQL